MDTFGDFYVFLNVIFKKT